LSEQSDAEGLCQLAASVLAQASSIVSFRRDRLSHPDWPSARSPGEPPAATLALAKAEQAMVDAAHELRAAEAMAAWLRNGTAPAHVKADAAAAVITARAAEAAATEAWVTQRLATQQAAQAAAEHAADAWLRAHVDALRASDRAFAQLLARAGTPPERGACAQLLQIAARIVRGGPLADLAAVDWAQLESAVGREVAALRAASPGAGDSGPGGEGRSPRRRRPPE